MVKLLKKVWFSISLQQKLWAFASIVTLVLAISAFFNFKLVEFSIDGFSDILNDNARCGAFLEAIEEESDAFRSFMREHTEKNRKDYEGSGGKDSDGAFPTCPFLTAPLEAAVMPEPGL